MPPTPDADTDDNGTDQPGTNPSTQPGAAGSGEAPSSEPDTGEAEDSADRDATEADQAATADSEDEPFPPHGALTLRALRWGGLIGAVVFAVTTLVLLRGLVDARNLIPDKVSALTTCMIVAGLLAWPFLNLRDKKRPVLATTMTTIMAALGVTASASLALAWWDTYQETGFSVLFLLALAGAALSATLFLSTGPLLHYLRSTAVGLGDDDDPSRWGHLGRRTGEKTDKGRPRYERIRVPHRTRACLAALVIAPALTLGSAIAGTWALVNPVHHVMAASPADTSLAPPTSLAPTATWTKEISSTKLTTVAGAGGPILLTDDGIMALNPKDGNVLWSYERKHANFNHNFLAFTNATAPLVTSPNGKYVALRVLSPKFVQSTGDTLVFDALTGRIVFKNLSTGGPLQLTDSAVLDGNSAFSLTDGKKLWTLSDGDRVDYSGTAGHSSFILDQYSEDRRHENSPQSYKSTIILRVTPQEDLSAAVEVDDVLANPPDHPDDPTNLVNFIRGWAARYTGEFDSSGNPVAEAISLDALAKVDGADTTTYPLGATSGINTEASRLSGSIVTYPVITADTASKRPQENARAATVFDPSTRTVTPASQDRSLSAARTGIVEIAADDGSTSAALVIRPGDDSEGTTIPITPGSTFQSPRELADYFNTPAQPLFSRDSDTGRRAKAVRTPGAVVAMLNATDTLYTSCGVNSDHQDQTCRSTYRIFGITGGQK